VSNLTTLFAPENTKKSSKPSRRAYFVQHLVDGTETERDPRNNNTCLQPPQKLPDFQNSDLSWHFHLAADGREPRQMAVAKKALFHPALQTLGQEEALLAASSALLLCAFCEEDDHAVMDQVTSC
jgi:hypothetical protein